MTVIVPGTAWWLEMLQIFVPVASALTLALIGYWFTLRSDLRSKGAEARLAIQRQAIEDVQQGLKDFWVTAVKLLRVPLDKRLQKPELLSRLEEASAALTVGQSRLQDRELANRMADWHHAMSLTLQSEQAMSTDDVSMEHQNFITLSDRLGARLREFDGRPS